MKGREERGKVVYVRHLTCCAGDPYGKNSTQATATVQKLHTHTQKGASTFVVLDYSQNVTERPVEGKVSPNYSTELLGGDQDCAQLMATETRTRESFSFLILY